MYFSFCYALLLSLDLWGAQGNAAPKPPSGMEAKLTPLRSLHGEANVMLSTKAISRVVDNEIRQRRTRVKRWRMVSVCDV